MLEVLAPGLCTTVQDLGRPGLGHLGIASGGAADDLALIIGNLLVGNPPGAAGLECTLLGPRLRLGQDTDIALTGAAGGAAADGRPLAPWNRVRAAAGSEIVLGPCRGGARSYLCVAGGIDVPLLLGSRSTDLLAGFGGLEGRRLRSGDRLPIGRAAKLRSPQRGASANPGPGRDPVCRLRFLPGREALVEGSLADEWQVTAQADRRGLRLAGPTLAVADPRPRRSEPVLPGTIQLPGDGQPIVLGVDAQSVGGYPRLGQVVRADLALLGQLAPGMRFRFEPCTLAQARALWARRQRGLARLAAALAP